MDHISWFLVSQLHTSTLAAILYRFVILTTPTP